MYYTHAVYLEPTNINERRIKSVTDRFVAVRLLDVACCKSMEIEREWERSGGGGRW